MGVNGYRFGCGWARACPELIENPSQIARFRLSENSLPDPFRCGTLNNVVVIVVIVIIMPMMISSSSSMTKGKTVDPERSQGTAVAASPP